VRSIRKWDLVALLVNSIIGAGIFGLPGTIYNLAGVYSILSFFVGALVTAAIVLCFAEVGSRFSATGGPYLYAYEALGPVIGFQIGWLAWLTRVTAYAALCNLFVIYLGYFWAPVTVGWWRTGLITGTFIAYLVVNLVGVRDAVLVNNLLTVGKLVPLLLFIVVGFFFVNRLNFAGNFQPSFRDFSVSTVLTFYAFSGFENAGVVAGETHNPRRDLPFGLVFSLLLVTVFYVSIQVVCIGTFPGLAHSERPLADASLRFWGQGGASLIALAGVISTAGTMNAAFLAAPRVLFAMAERGQLMTGFAATHRRFHTPYIAIFSSGVVMLALTLSGTFISMAKLTTIIRLLTYISTCAALPVLRRREGQLPAMFRLRAGSAVSTVAIVLCVVLLSTSSLGEAGAVGVAIAIGLGLYIAQGSRKRRSVTADPG
jgi:amino acid transporter